MLRGAAVDFDAGGPEILRLSRCLVVVALSLVAGSALVAAVPAAAQNADAPAGPLAGRPLADVLGELLPALRDDGFTLVFSSELVGVDAVVATEPVASEPRALLDELLAPLGLGVEEGPGGVLAVVALPDGEAPVPAETEPYSRPYIEDEIVVRPSRLSLGHAEPKTSFSLSEEEIGELPHLGGDLFRTLPLLPGVTGNDVSARFSVRGGRRDEVGVVLDGQELYDAYHLKDYDDALSIVPSAVLAGADLATGALAADRGDRMGGTLDLTTAPPPAERHTTLGLSVVDATATSTGRFAGERAGWLLSLRRGGLDLAHDAIGDEDPKFWDALGKLEWRPGESWGVTGRFLAANDELDFTFVDDEDRERLDTGYDSRHAWLTHDAVLGDDLWVETTGSFARVTRNRGGAASEEEGSFVLSDRRELEVRALAQRWGWQVAPRHALSWGAELRRYDARFDYAKDLEPEFEIEAPFAPERQTVTDFADRLEGEHRAGWVSDRFSLGRLAVEAGLRFDRHTATGDDLWSPRLALGWQLTERSVLRAAWGRFQQSQRPYELLVEDGDTALHPAEQADHAVLGWEALLANNPLGLEAVRVEAYRRVVDEPRRRYVTLLEPLNFFPEIEPGRVRIEPERVTSEGIELLVRGRLGPRTDWWMTYTRSRVEERIGGREVPSTFDQPHALSLVAHRRLGRDWDLTLAWRWHTGWPTTRVDGVLVEDDEGEEELTAVFGPLNGERLGPYHRLDLRLARTWSAPSGEWTVYLDVQNLYDRENAAGFDVEIDDDAGVVRLIDEGWPGLFPSFGVVWKF